MSNPATFGSQSSQSISGSSNFNLHDFLPGIDTAIDEENGTARTEAPHSGTAAFRIDIDAASRSPQNSSIETRSGGKTMAYTLEQLCADIRTTLKADASAKGRQAVVPLVAKALRDEAFVAAHITKDACKPRKVLFEDPELGFAVCGHVYEGQSTAKPHDHGSSWAIYGLAAGTTQMTDWRIVKNGDGAQPALVEAARVYDLNPGDAHFYDVGMVHSPKFNGLTKLLRIEGANLDRVKRSNIAAA
jgi:hypothetical protein